MSTRKWSFEEVDYFVTLYRSHECLWNQTHTGQKKKDNAYADIQERMLKERNFNLEIEEIKEKILTLRDLFLDLKKKYNNCPPPHLKKTTWYMDMEYVMTNYKSKLFDKNSGESFEKTIPMSTTIETDYTNSSLKLSECKETLSEDVIISDEEVSTSDEEVSTSDDEEESKLAEDGSDMSTIKQSKRIMILEVLKKLYSDKFANDYPDLMDAVSKIANENNDLATIDLKKFVNIINVLGFIQKKTICGQTIIVEKADQRFERYNYFTKIKTARIIQNRQIVYIDERIIDPKLGFEKVYSVMHHLPDESTVYFHALTRDGLLNGIFSNQATEKEFTKWVSTILMSYLKSPSLIIMDRGPLHGVLEDSNPITRYSSKSEMLKWLIDNNVPFNGNMPRPVLFELIRKYRNVNKDYKIDKIFKSHGHKVLRLPYTFPDLNLSHLFWVAVSDGVPMLKKSIPKHQQIVQDKIKESVHLVGRNKKKCHEMEKLLILKENEIYQIDIAIENMLENYQFKNK